MRLQYEAQRRMTFAVAQAIALAFNEKAKVPPTWDEAKAQAKRREHFRKSVFVVKGRKSLAGTKSRTKNSD